MVEIPHWIISWLHEWGQIAAGFGSLCLSLGLVILYRMQQDLLKREMNREVKQSHTETLRKRIRAWHGDMEEIGVRENEFLQDDSNLPYVNSASVESAPSVMPLSGDETDFRVIPEAIESDLYLHDLLENHSPELRRLTEKIEAQYTQFSSLRSSFRNECPEGEVVETDDYTIQPLDQYSKWVFERAVRLNRSQVDSDKQYERDIAENRLRGVKSGDSKKGALRYSPIPPEGGPATYEAVLDTGDLGDFDEFEEEIDDKIVEIHLETINNIDSDGPYDYAVRAGEVLDEMNKSIAELRGKLVEYEGHPVYTEDCPYIEDATI